MCKSHLKGMNILKAAWDRHAYSCCPNVHDIDPVQKVSSFQAIEGVYPVYNDMSKQILAEMRNMTSWRMCRDVAWALRNLFDNSSSDDVAKNIIRKDLFDRLKTAIENQNLPPDHPDRFELIKKSSPKWSNLLASLLKYNGYDPEKHDLTKMFNDRGTSQLDEYEFVITTEQHRIVGMSAFGVYTSCQDWIAKSDRHEYHYYTHQAWANLLDPTVGVAFIRRKGDEQPTIHDTNVQDMLARSLIRILELEDGRVIVYLHRIYGHNPYNKYIQASIDAWEKTLPDNWHVIKMYEKPKKEFRSGENKHGVQFEGFAMIKFHIDKPVVVYGVNRYACSECDGRGENTHVCDECGGSGCLEHEELVDCPDCGGEGRDEDGNLCYSCDGYGEVWELTKDECYYCDGRGEWEDDCEYCCGEGYLEEDDVEYEPYNDHGEWISFYHNYISFEVPLYILNWDIEPTDALEYQEMEVAI